MRFIGISFICICGLLATASGQQSKPNFSGKWQTNGEKSQIHSGKAAALTLSIEQKGASIHVVRTAKSSDGKDSVVEFTCTTDGKDCDAGSTKVSLWYDGMSLVEMDVSDAQVLTTKLTLDNPTTIVAVVSYMSPKAEADNFVLQKL
jgi:hypothetical protein